MTGQIGTLGLEISRPVLSHSQLDLTELRAMGKEAGFSSRSLRVYAKESDRILTVSISELSRFFDSVDKEMSPEVLNALAEHLDITLGSEVDEPLEAEILPYSHRPAYDETGSIVFAIGGELSERVLHERELAINAITRFVNVRRSSYDWEVPVNVGDYMLARLFDTSRLEEMHAIVGEFLGRSVLKITVGPTEIIDTFSSEEVERLGKAARQLSLPTHIQLAAFQDTSRRSVSQQN